MKSTDIKKRKVMDFDVFKDAYSKVIVQIEKDPDAPTMDGARKMTAYPGRVRHDANPYRVFGIPYDKDQANANDREMARPPLVATVGGANGIGEIGESARIRFEGERAWRLPEDRRGEGIEVIEKLMDAAPRSFADAGYDFYSDPVIKFQNFDVLSKKNQDWFVFHMKRIGAKEVTDSVFNESYAKPNLPVGTEVWSIIGPFAGKEHSAKTLGEPFRKGQDMVVEVSEWTRLDTGVVVHPGGEIELDYIHRADGKDL